MWQIEPTFTVRLGGNTFINTPDLVAYRGTSIFRLRRNDDDGTLGIDFEVFDAKGNRVATFAKGVVVHGDTANYQIDSGHDSYSVTDRSSGKVIARVQRRGVQGAELDVQVNMYLPDGRLLEAGPTETKIGSQRFSGNVIKDCKFGMHID